MIYSEEGVRRLFIHSQVAERALLNGVDIGFWILPIPDGLITRNYG
jgi:hypothetical protein